MKIEFTVSFDDKGFAVNCDVGCESDPTWEFQESTVAAYLILVTKSICQESGLDFMTLLKNTMMAEEKSRDKWVYAKEADA